MQKLINVLAVASFVTSAAIVAGGLTLYNNRAQIFEYAEERAMELVKESIPLPTENLLPTESLPIPGAGGGGSVIPTMPFGM